MTVELLLLVPVIVTALLGLVAFGALGYQRTILDSASASAARAASLADTPAQASADARASATDTLIRAGKACTDVDIDIDMSDFGPGGQVSVTVRCTADLTGLALLPAKVRRASTSRSPLETHRDFGRVSP